MLTTVMPLISMMKIDSLGEDEFLSSWSSEWVCGGGGTLGDQAHPTLCLTPHLAPWHAQKPKIYITDPRNPENTAKKSTSSPPATAAGARGCCPFLFADTSSRRPSWICHNLRHTTLAQQRWKITYCSKLKIWGYFQKSEKKVLIYIFVKFASFWVFQTRQCTMQQEQWELWH